MSITLYLGSISAALSSAVCILPLREERGNQSYVVFPLLSLKICVAFIRRSGSPLSPVKF